ncbi:MAG: acyl-CoA dehydrogenase [Betaproteobacteria bacterium]|nr:acyl-CoA dehydrogenase [Betaproteobacteria bacterium]NBP45748.1 acyl-CoA dehydrogenase [Betaproteobacteria bacterium]
MPICGDDYPLSDKQRHLMALARQLGAERFAPRAAQLDREAQFPFENYEDMRQAGLLGLCVPESHGGLGADYATYALVSAEIGRYCGATALTFNMHVCTTLWSGLLSEDLEMSAEQRALHRAHRAVHFARVVKEGAVYAQPFSEGGAAAAGAMPFGTTAVKVPGGWRVNGKKIFASLSDAADYFGVLCTEKKADADLSRRDTLYLAIPRSAPGLSVEGEWDPLGMRATVSRNLVFKDVFVPDDAALMPQGLYFQAASRWPHMFMTLSPTYMGIAQAAYDFTVAYLRGEIAGTGPVKRRQFATKQVAVAEMFIKLEQTRNLFLRAIEDARVDPAKSTRLRAYAAQFTIMENAQDLARLAIRTCGGQSMLKSLPLERLYRDARCGSLMLPWTAELCMDRIGREALYEAGEKDE